MTLIDAIILGIVQGLTEFLPISSSGHLALSHQLLGFDKKSAGIEFDILLHFATLLAVLIYFRKKLILMIVSLLKQGKNKDKKMIWLLIIGTLPVVFIGLLLKDSVETLSSNPSLVCTLLCITGIILFLPVWLKSNKTRNLGKTSAVIIGFSQALAILPGISRSGLTITTGMMLGVSPKTAAEFSFLLAIPAILGGTILKMNEISSIPANQFGIYLSGMTAAFITGLIAIFCVLNLISKGKFAYFGFYCLFIGTTGLIYFASR
jgi:undecaprenyl-diphosphatase